MMTGKSGTFDLTMDNSFAVRIAWSESYDAVANASILASIRAYLYSAAWTGTWYPQGTISVGGEPVVTMSYAKPATHVTNGSVYKNYAEIVKYENGLAPPWSSGTIAHNTDGSKEVTITVDLAVYNAETNVIRDIGSYSKTIALTHIPRASTIGATDANVGAVSMIAVNKKSSSYTHSIAYKFGSLSGYLTADGGVSTSEVKMSSSSVAFAIPSFFYEQIPDAKAETCTLTCKTYSGSTQIGDAQTATFIVTASEEACKPVVSGLIEDANEATLALTGDAGKLVRFYSTALCTISAEARNSASISQKKIGGIDVSGDTRNIAEIETTSVTFYALDSRGYSSTAVVTPDIVPYVKLTCNPYGKRTDPTSGNAVLTAKGNYYNGSFGAVENGLAIKYRYAAVGEDYGEYISLDPVMDGDAYTAEAALRGLDYMQAYNVEIVAADALSEISKTVVIDQGIPVADWGKDDFRFNVPVLFTAKSFGKELPADGKYGQVFFLDNGDGTYSLCIHNGTSWS